jgi:hypothetical protein
MQKERDECMQKDIPFRETASFSTETEAIENSQKSDQ